MLQEPVRPTPHETPPTRPSGRRLGLLGLIVIGCLALAVPIIGAITASSDARALAAGASAAPAAPDQPGHGNGNGKVHGPKADKGLRGNRAPGHGPITIVAIAGSQVSLRTVDGWTRTITIAPTTTITKAGQTINVADLKVGDAIRFHQVRNADGTFTVDAVVVPTPETPHVAGLVITKTSTTITIKRGDGSTATIHVTDKTTYRVKGKAAATIADIAVGDRLHASGTIRADGSLDAIAVGTKGPEGDGGNDPVDDDDAPASAAPG